MNTRVNKILSKLQLGSDQIYSSSFYNSEQQQEIALRERVAARQYTDYLAQVANHHSVPVMDYEIKRFIMAMPNNAVIVDVGGCWGWHWRSIDKVRPDIVIVIVDFVRNNLLHACKVLEGKINKNIFLVHGDAVSLPFPDSVFDGYWSVQALQHIPNFDKAVLEAKRVLSTDGKFSSYSLNIQPWMRWIYNLLGKKYLSSGNVDDMYYLARASAEQEILVSEIFNNSVKKRYTEVLFQPGVKFVYPGRENNVLGRLDSFLSGSSRVHAFFARQCAYFVEKNE